jgi:hypothetical protein
VTLLFTAPKAFAGEAAPHQRNALRSWSRLQPAVRILLLGDEPGVAEIAQEIGAEHESHVERNEYGTPLVDSLFRAAHARASAHELLAYANADIILLDDFRRALDTIDLDRFLLAGRRRNVLLDDELGFEPGWQDDLRRRARRGRLETPWGSDYFVFRADGTFAEVPPFAVGRARWDNWLIAKARHERIPVIDGTNAVIAVHQLHGHDHIAGYTGSQWGGPESDANDELARSLQPNGVIFHLWDATHVLGAGGPRPARRPVRAWRALKVRLRS